MFTKTNIDNYRPIQIGLLIDRPSQLPICYLIPVILGFMVNMIWRQICFTQCASLQNAVRQMKLAAIKESSNLLTECVSFTVHFFAQFAYNIWSQQAIRFYGRKKLPLPLLLVSAWASKQSKLTLSTDTMAIFFFKRMPTMTTKEQGLSTYKPDVKSNGYFNWLPL